MPLPRSFGSLDAVKTRLRDIGLWSYHSYDSRKVKSGLTEAELLALQQLSANKDIVVQKSDKGNSVVILDKAVYTQKLETILSDASKFEPVTFRGGKLYNYIVNCEDRIRSFLRTLIHKQTITEETYSSIAPKGSVPGKLYGLCKVHKQGFPLRPILSAIGTPQYCIAKFLVPLLRDVTENQWTVKDSFTFAKELTSLDSTGLVMGSLDVESLFTNVPLEETIGIVVDQLFKESDVVSGFTKADLTRLLDIAVKDVVFVCNGNFYKQTDGVAMGSPLGPTLANAFLAYHEQHWIDNCPGEFKPVIYRRYVDDVFALFKSTEHIAKFREYLNEQHPNIRFTSEVEQDGNFAFLDVNIESTNGRFVTSVYRKKTFSGVFSNYDSFIARVFKVGLVLTLLHRAHSICSTWALFHEECQNSKSILRRNGYPMSFLDNCIQRFVDSVFKPKMPVSGDAPKTVILVLPFLGKHSLDIRSRVLKLMRASYPSVRCRIVFKSMVRMSNYFQFKDRHPLTLSSNVVYVFRCVSCNASYVGKTTRHLHCRVSEHKGVSDRTGAVRKVALDASSSILSHIKTSSHAVSFSDFSVIARAQSDFFLKIKESLIINRDRPSLNIQGQVKNLPLALF